MVSVNRCVFIILVSLFLTSCYTPAGKLKDSDFISKEITLNTSVSASLSNLHQGFRYCGMASGGLFSLVRHGAPSCVPAKQPDGPILCDIFLGLYSPPNDFVLGRIELKPAGSGTSAMLRLAIDGRGNEKTVWSWEMFLRGQEREVCPDNF